jgi:hypothetical protein
MQVEEGSKRMLATAGALSMPSLPDLEARGLHLILSNDKDTRRVPSRLSSMSLLGTSMIPDHPSDIYFTRSADSITRSSAPEIS